jgi:5'-nucleotidase
MKILLTNDDGIGSPGLLLLAEALREGGRHRVFVVAPDSNRSAISHAITFMYGAIKLSSRGPDSWACSGLPADCVMAALLGGIAEKPDLVVSGINRGLNIGTDLVYSGTAAAARQAALYHIPGIALSLAGGSGGFHWKGAVRFAAEELEGLLALWREDIFLNVNIPAGPGPYRGKQITWPGRRIYRDSLAVMKTREGYVYCTLDSGTADNEPEPGSDGDAVSRGFVSVSPVFVHPVIRRDLCPGAPDYAGAAPRPMREE